MTTATPETVDTTDRAALLTWYPSEQAPQPVELCLDIEDGELFFHVNPEIGNAVPARHWNGIVQTWTVPALTPDAANELLGDVRDLVQRILDDSEIVWDGSSHVGHLGEQAVEAYDEIANLIDELPEEARLNACEAVDYFTDTDVNAQILADAGLTADTTDAELDTIAERLADEALSEANLVVVHVDDWLKQERDRMREDVIENLDEIVDEYEALEQKRDTIVRQMVAWGRSLREIGSQIHRSHQTVANIAAKED